MSNANMYPAPIVLPDVHNGYDVGEVPVVEQVVPASSKIVTVYVKADVDPAIQMYPNLPGDVLMLTHVPLVTAGPPGTPVVVIRSQMFKPLWVYKAWPNWLVARLTDVPDVTALGGFVYAPDATPPVGLMMILPWLSVLSPVAPPVKYVGVDDNVNVTEYEPLVIDATRKRTARYPNTGAW
jgi:hypothetical protein